MTAHYSTETITPAMATAMLERNTRNRPLNEKSVIHLARAIQRGEWKVNGDVIRFATDGRLVDGQHRLHAIVKAGVPVQTGVVRGLDPDVFDTVDVGRVARTAAHVLAMQQVPNATKVAAAAGLLFRYEATGNPYAKDRLFLPTVAQIEQTLASNPELVTGAGFVEGKKTLRSLMAASSTIFLKVAFSKYCDADLADAFLTQLDSGADLAKGSPILALRNYLVADRYGVKSASAAYKGALTVKAFNKWVMGETVSFLRVRLDGDNPEKDIYRIVTCPRNSHA